MDNTIYPDKYAILQAMNEFCQRTFLDQFAQKKGVFLANAKQDQLSEFLSKLFYEHKELEEIRKSALQIHEKSFLSGFRVNSDDIDFDLLAILDKNRDSIVDVKNNMRVQAIIERDKKVFHGSIEYTQKKPGRVEFLQGTDRNFNYFVRHISGGLWEIIVDGSRSNDARILEEWLGKQLPRQSEIYKIDQDKLNIHQTIKFFDNLAKEGSGNDWRFIQVTRLIIRRDGISSSQDDENSQEFREAQESELSGISSAILEGKELRNNPFVKECENNGYRFTAMTYEYEHKTQPYAKQIRAEFKKKPKIFELILDKYIQISGLDQTREEIPISDSQRIKILSDFWGIARKTFEDLLDGN